MAKLVCVSWIPRSHIHLFETYMDLSKVGLNVSDVKFDDKLSFRIRDYGSYPEISFTQEWSGLHYFVADVEGDGVASQFIRDMQILLLNEILKKCHTITFKHIVADIIPLDFHVVVLSKERVDVKKDFVERKAGELTVAFDPREVYSTGTVSYVFGSEDESLMNVLLYHAYVEVAADFLMNMMKRMTRLYHEAANTVKSLGSAEDFKLLNDAITMVDEIKKNGGESFGKLKQAKENFNLKLGEYRRKQFSETELRLAEALEVEKSLERICVDAGYMSVGWENVLMEYLRNIDSTLNARLMSYSILRKRGLFGW